MKTLSSRALGILLLVLASLALQVNAAPQSPGSRVDNPYNSPIRNANPNSRQGSVPDTPAVRAPSTAPAPRQPSLENRGIGNGQRLPAPKAVPIQPGGRPSAGERR